MSIDQPSFTPIEILVDGIRCEIGICHILFGQRSRTGHPPQSEQNCKLSYLEWCEVKRPDRLVLADYQVPGRSSPLKA